MEEFFAIRLQFYEKRKDYLMSKLARECEILTNKERFILEVVEERLVLRNKKKAKLVEELKEKGYTKNSHFPKVRSTKLAQGGQREEAPEGDGVAAAEEGDEAKEYNYLLGMPMWNLTFEKVEEIKKSREEKENELRTLEKTHAKEIWNADLQEFLAVLDKVELEEEEDRKKGDDKQKAANKGIKAKKNHKKDAKPKDKVKGEKKAINWDTDGESVSENPFKVEKAEEKTERAEEKSKKGGRGRPKKETK
jgi:DNA topoisomerase-2